MSDLVAKVLEEGKLLDYLGGFPRYGLRNPVAFTPTDSGAVLDSLAGALLADGQVRADFRKALVELAGDEERGWSVVYYLVDLQYFQKQHGLALVDEGLLKEIAEGLRANKTLWVDNGKWVGAQNEGGLWGVVVGMKRLLHAEYGLVLLPEEL